MNIVSKTAIMVALAVASTAVAVADDIKTEDFNPISTGVASLGITPDARGASMGDMGVASDPDVNSQYWNPSKYAFAYSTAGIGLSYTPWLRKIVNDIFLANLAGYYKIGSGDNQAVSLSMRYFSLGEISTSDPGGAVMASINPFELAVDVGYSRKLSEKFSMGVALRYIYSDLAYGGDSQSPEQSKGASAFGADISGYFCTYPVIGRNECQWTVGFNISNIGSKVNYNSGNDPAFLPTNRRLGTAFTFPLADYHNLTLGVDFNKLLVPAKPRQQDYLTPEGAYDYEAYSDALQKWKDMSPITGIFKSFTDAPGGFKEEIKEINYSIGAEYAYNQQFFLRGGYFHESRSKGNRQYFGFGAGFSLNVIRLDASYMIATAQQSPLDQTLRFTVTFDLDGIKNLFNRRR